MGKTVTNELNIDKNINLGYKERYRTILSTRVKQAKRNSKIKHKK